MIISLTNFNQTTNQIPKTNPNNGPIPCKTTLLRIALPGRGKPPVAELSVLVVEELSAVDMILFSGIGMVETAITAVGEDEALTLSEVVIVGMIAPWDVVAAGEVLGAGLLGSVREGTPTNAAHPVLNARGRYDGIGKGERICSQKKTRKVSGLSTHNLRFDGHQKHRSLRPSQT